MLKKSIDINGRLIGYARVGTADQDLKLQIVTLQKSGCKKIYDDKASGAKRSRPGLVKCMETLQSGDTLVVWRLDRLGRSMKDLVDIVSWVSERGIGFRSLMDGAIDTTTASGELIFNVFAALAQFERDLIRERTIAGLEAARKRGRKGGRPKKSPNDPLHLMVQKLSRDRNMTVREICSTLNISRSTYYRHAVKR